MSEDIQPSPSPYIHASKLPLQEIKESTISKIELSEADQAKLKKTLNSPRVGEWSKDIKQRKLVGQCLSCDAVPEYILTKYYEGLKVIERYCSKCLEREKGNKVNE